MPIVHVTLSALLLMGGAVSSIVDDSEVRERSEESHCVVFVVDQRADGELVLSQPECFSDETSADARSLAGHVSWFSSSTEATLESDGVLASSSVLGKHYEGLNGSGSSITIVGSSCTGGYWNTGSTWANRISSSYHGCQRLTHWDQPNKQGAKQSTYGVGTIKNLTTLNNKTKSVSYHSS
jgi:hypothetical protein